MLMPFRYLIKKPKQGEKMDNAQELKAHLQDSNKARMYEEKKISEKQFKCFVCKNKTKKYFNKTKQYFTCNKTNRVLCEDCVEIISSDEWGNDE